MKHTIKIFKNAKRWILSFLLHYANRNASSEYFYKVKNTILAKHGEHIGYDIQFIEGKECWSCEGTGIYKGYNYRDGWYKAPCFKCYSGWYKRPTWNILAVLKLGKYTFHQPFQRVYEKPVDFEGKMIDGYIHHSRTKYGDLAVFILCLIYERGYLKRYWQQSGTGWYCYWYYPENWLPNIIHILKHPTNSIPLRDFIQKAKNGFRKKPVFYSHQNDYDDSLPF